MAIDYKRLIIILLIIMIIICCWSQFEGFTDNIKRALTGSNRREMILYYSKKCPHSVEMESTWDMFVKAHQNDPQKLPMRKIDVDKTNAPIPILPVIRVLDGGRVIGELEGNQSYDALDAFYLQLARFIF